LLFGVLQLRRRYLSLALYIILVGVSVQMLIAGQQLLMYHDAWVPLYGRRAYGTFFQPNVLASFLATGLAILWALTVLPHYASSHATTERVRQAMLLTLMTLLSALLVWIQSRVGWLGGIAVVVLFVWRLGPQFPRRCRFATLAVLLGTLSGVVVLLFGNDTISTVNHSHSNLARWLMLRDTLAMIAAKPILGWGYGGFEFDFQHFRINQVPPTAVSEIARHPHNELLLWVVEGGMVALCGLLVLLAGLLRIVQSALYRDRRAFAIGSPSAGVPTAMCIALVPIALHTQLEFPLYLSVPHALTFLLLLAMADRFGGARSPAPRRHRAFAVGMTCLAAGGALTAGFALYGHQTLTQVERFGMADVTAVHQIPPPSRWLLQERATFDLQVNTLLTFNQTRDEHLLTQYRQWAEDYLQRRIDKNVYATLIMILRHQQHTDDAERYRRDAARFFPGDARFAPPAPSSQEG
jgi:O-antigen polymerase